MTIGNSRRQNRIRKALKPLVDKLNEEGSQSSRFLKRTIEYQLKKRVSGTYATDKDHAIRTLDYFYHTLCQKVEEAIRNTSTAREARKYLIEYIKAIDIIEVDSITDQVKEEYKALRCDNWHILKAS